MAKENATQKTEVKNMDEKTECYLCGEIFKHGEMVYQKGNHVFCSEECKELNVLFSGSKEVSFIFYEKGREF